MQRAIDSLKQKCHQYGRCLNCLKTLCFAVEVLPADFCYTAMVQPQRCCSGVRGHDPRHLWLTKLLSLIRNTRKWQNVEYYSCWWIIGENLFKESCLFLHHFGANSSI